jgi:uncharacterized RDD family membrane protein YckC
MLNLIAPASHFRRFLAAIIDGIFFNFIFVGCFWILPPIDFSNVGHSLLLIFLVLTGASFAYWIVNGWLHENYGGGPGKVLLGLAVHDHQSGQNIGWNKAAMRDSFGKLVSLMSLGLGFMMGYFRSDRRMLHDFMASTRVVNTEVSLSPLRMIVGSLVALALLATTIGFSERFSPLTSFSPEAQESLENLIANPPF